MCYVLICEKSPGSNCWFFFSFSSCSECIKNKWKRIFFSTSLALFNCGCLHPYYLDNVECFTGKRTERYGLNIFFPFGCIWMIPFDLTRDRFQELLWPTWMFVFRLIFKHLFFLSDFFHLNPVYLRPNNHKQLFLLVSVTNSF